MYTAMPKKELLRVIKRFLEDKERGISVSLFSDLCGLSAGHLYEVFVYENEPLTEMVQKRVTNGYNAWKNGYVAIMKNRDNTRFVDYRRDARPEIVESYGISFTNSGIKLNIGMKNRRDYDYQTIDEQLKRG